MLKPYFKKYFFHYVFGLLALVIVDIIQLRIPVITGVITDGLEQGTMDQSELFNLMGWLLAIGISITILRFAWRNLIFGTARKVEYELRNDFFEHLETLSTSFFNKRKTGDLMAYATNDLNSIRMLVGPGVLMVLDTFVLTTIVVYQMIKTTDLSLTLFAVIPMPVIALASLLLGKVIRNRYDKKQEAFAYLSDIVQENISGIRVIKAFVQEGFEMMQFDKVNRDNYNKNMKVVKIQALMFPLAMLITGVSITITLGYGGRLTMLGTISLGEFVAFIQYIMMLIWPMIAFGWFINIYSQGMASVARYNEILTTVSEIHEYSDTKSDDVIVSGSSTNPKAKSDDVTVSASSTNPKADNKGVHKTSEKNWPVSSGDIILDQLTFRYPDTETDVLEDISLHIKAGEHVGIVGRTGSGKTTLVNLLLRIFEAPTGAIKIDNKIIKEWNIKELRKSMGYVPQDNFLFSDTIKNNIGFGLDEFSQEEIEKAAMSVDVHDNIMEFEDNYETVIGERGVTLSGGQKQRVSIARALIKNTPVLILDDAVSAVDTKTEEQILNHLQKVRKNKTTITIAHRISTVQHSDRIYVLDEGKLVEFGNHIELLAQEGIYYGMVMKQQLEKSIAESE